MKRALALVAIAALTLAAARVAASGRTQATDAGEILSAARAALGGEKKLAEVMSFVGTGSSTRVVGDRSSEPGDVEIAFELPDRYIRKTIESALSASFTRTRGFNGDAVIEVLDQPPASAGRVIIRMGSGAGPGQTLTPEQQEEQKARQLIANRQDFARLVLGILLASPEVYPLRFSYGGVAESPDGKADIVEVTGEGGFSLGLFIDRATRLPLMARWMAREPLRVMTAITSGGRGVAIGAGAGTSRAIAGKDPSQMTPEEREKLMRDLEEQRKEAEAKLRTVEYRLYYGDYREVDGVMVPFRLQWAIDGKPTEEIVFDRVRINQKIDPKKFDPAR